VADWGTIDILVNNAGIAIPKGILEAELDDWNKVLAPTTANIPNPTTPPSSLRSTSADRPRRRDSHRCRPLRDRGRAGVLPGTAVSGR
jgi:NAD(P)-dependent dehydrogenase (short-subunit alcohol dehydrogenase family)